MFRTQDNIPEIYVNESRDFQLFCKAKDLVFGGVKYNIDSLRHTSNTMEMNGSLLPLLKSKVGFFDQDNLSEDELRYLLAAFPYMMKYKGAKKSIAYIINMWLRLYKISGKIVLIDINNIDYTINLFINALPKSTYILDKLFKYIVPTGYSLKYHFVESSKQEHVAAVVEMPYQGITILNKSNAQVRSAITTSTNNNLSEDKLTLADRLVGAVGFTDIVNSEDLVKSESESANEIELIPKEEEEESDV